MKKYISQNWRKIMKFICFILLLLILIYKFTAPKTIIRDYIKYGKDVTRVGFNSEVIDEARNNATDTWNSVDPQLAKLITVLMVAILIITFLSAISSKAGDSKGGKKK